MKNKSIIVLIPLNIASFNRNESNDEEHIKEYYSYMDIEGKNEFWIKNRINIFMNYTYKSLVNQTNQDFTACIIYDDKTENLIVSELMKYGELQENIRFIGKSIIDNFIKEKIVGSEYVYFVRIDSDDMYHKSYIQKLYDYTPLPETVALINEWAYLYDSYNHKLFECKAKVLSCYTLIFKTEDYLSGAVPTVVTNQLDAQMGVAQYVLKKEYLDGINYAWHVHSKNTVTSTEEWFTNEWTTYLSDEIKDEKEIKEIMEAFMGKDGKS